MAPIGLAILGAGIFAKEAHLPNLAPLGPDVVSLKAIYSRSEKSARELASAAEEALHLSSPPDVYFDVGASTSSVSDSLTKLLSRQDIQAVLVILPITLQPAIVLAALQHGKHVLSEKPIGPDVASARSLIQEYNTKFKPKGLIWRIAENFELEPGYIKAGEIIRKGTIGKVSSFNVRVVNHVAKDSKWYKTPWRTIPDYQGGFLLDGGVHTVAAMRTILPTPLWSLSAHASLNMPHLPPHDCITAAVQCYPSATGSTPIHGLVELNFGAPTVTRSQSAKNGIFVQGDEGYLFINQVDGKFRISVNTIVRDEKTGEDKGEKEEVVEEKVCGVEEELKSFFEAVSQGKTGGEVGKPENALIDVAFIQAGLTSEGKTIDLSELVRSG